ncbi:MAG: hypothetical protein AAGD11_01255 [Planctomycetota bacterium]
MLLIWHPCRTYAVDWIGGSSDWETAANWSTSVVPDGAADNVFISPAGGSTVLLNSGRTVGSLTVAQPSDRLNLSPGSSLRIEGNSWDHEGVIELQANPGQFSELIVTNPVGYTGFGNIRFSDENLSTSLTLNSTLTVQTENELIIEGTFPGGGRGGIDGTGSISLGIDNVLVFKDLNSFSVDVSITGGGEVRVGGNSGSFVTINSPNLFADTFLASGNSTVRLNNVTSAVDELFALDSAKLQVTGGSFAHGSFEATEFLSGTIGFIGSVDFSDNGPALSTLKSAATMRADGPIFVEGVLATESGASIVTGVDGELLADGFEIQGAGSLNIAVPISVRSEGLTFNHGGTVSLGGFPLDLEQGDINIQQGTVSSTTSTLNLPALRDNAINLSGGSTLRLTGVDTARIGISSTTSSTVELNGGSLRDVKLSGGTTRVESFVTVREALEWNGNLELAKGASLLATGGDVSLLGNGEIEFLDEPPTAATPEILSTAGSKFVIPSGETLVMSGKQGRIAQTATGEAALQIDGALVVAAEEVEFGADWRIATLGTGTVIQGGRLRLVQTLNMNPADVPEELAATSTGTKPGGTLVVDAGGEVVMANGSIIEGGTIQTTGDGAVRVEFSTLQGGFATLEDVDLQGLMKVPGQADLGLHGTLNNTGRIELGEGTTSAFQFTDVVINGEVNLAGNGEMEWIGGGRGRFLAQSGSGGEPSHLINASSLRAPNGMTFGTSAANAMAITNRGVIVADDDLEIYLPVGEELVNEGTIQLTTNDSRLFFRTGGSVIRNSGQIDLADPGSRVLVGTYIQDGGMTKGLGTLQGNVTLNGGTLQLGGTVDGTITFNTGVVEIGDPVGRLLLTRDFNQSANTTLRIDIGGTTPETEFDVLDVQGFFGFLGGPLEVSLLDLGGGLFLPDSADTFQVLQTFNSVTGAFSNVAEGARLTTVDGLGSFVVNYGFDSPFGFNNVVLSDFQFELTADFDNDGDVDAADLAMWQTAYAATSSGDTDGDGDSDGLDLLRWQRQRGIGPISVEAATSVPEPNTVALAALALVSLSIAGRRFR